jgi:hypothetical protein
VFEIETIPTPLKEWLIQEWDYGLETIPYGAGLRDVWYREEDPVRSAMEAEARSRIKSTSTNWNAEMKAFSESFFESSHTKDYGVPYYHGILNRTIRLLQIADFRRRGDYIRHVVGTTIPTNDRNASVYVPHVAPDWNVIVVDWGFITALWNISVCFGKILPILGSGDNDHTISFDASRVSKAIADNALEVARIFRDTLLPFILMGEHPPMHQPLPLTDSESVHGNIVLILNCLIFTLVAHEYAHICLSHPTEQTENDFRPLQREFEADSLALIFALHDPWQTLGQNNLSIVCIACQALLLTLFQTLEVGDKMRADLGLRRLRFFWTPIWGKTCDPNWSS